jgi:excinuclease ABC subunit A
MGQDKVVKIVGAREHNLKNISLEIPRDRFIVVTGISGSGKSSLAFDTIYAEGNRRYVESLSPYARQFLEQVGKPDVESIEGLPPTISIEKYLGRTNPRSTVATTTEIHDYVRLLFARIGKVHCYKCGREVRKQSAQEIVDRILDFPEGAPIVLLAPLVRGKKGEHRDILNRVRREGFVRVRVNGEMFDVRSVPTLKKTKKYSIEAVVDRLTVSREVRGRIQDSVELALRFGEGLAVVSSRGEKGWADTIFSELYACPECGVSFEELSPRMFSFNSPYGACPKCSGMGTTMKLDEDMVIPDESISIRAGAIHPWFAARRIGRRFSYRYYDQTEFLKEDLGIDIDVPFKFIPPEKKQVLLYGDNNGLFEGVIPGLMRRFETTTSEHIKKKILEYMSELPCSACKGARLRPESLAVTVGEKNIYQVSLLSTREALKFFSSLSLTSEEAQIASLVLRELKARLGFMIDVGLYYITLDRQTSTLSSGEAQRIRLATQIGSGLVGVCYCLDEPTVGLHQRDNARLLSSLLRLRDMGNTVIVVEHDEETIRCADYIVDMGPGAGHLGGEVVVAGAISDVVAQPRSVTGQYLSGKLSIPIPLARRRLKDAEVIEVRGAAENNLKRINVKFPLGGFSCVTGVSGSGKSTLVNQVLFRALQRKLFGTGEKPGKHERIYGDENIERVVEVSQLPIGRTPRSNPATYSGAFTHIRQLFAMTKDAKVRGYTISRFSFNVKGGRCEECEGQGTKKIEMHFLPDVYVRCETCKGKRYNRETLEVKFKGLNIAEVLELRVSEALELFKNYPALHKILKTLYDVGLGYLQLGQPSTTLSGGEAQRIKLAYELAKGSAKSTLYIMDEPTIGLHFADISRLLDVINRLIESGGSFVVIEHNMDVIKTADYIIDLGPGGGDEGGRVVACGTPEEVAANENSVTGSYLARVMRLPLPRVKSEIA